MDRLKELRATDVQALLQILSHKRELGDTTVALPCFWNITFNSGTGLTTEQQYQESK